MNKLETKNKGDIGVTQVVAELTKQGFDIALPIAEHLPFDILVINSKRQVKRVSVKYKKIGRFGSIEIPLRTISSNSQGYKIKHANFDEIDCIAIYCPDTDKCYFVSSLEIKEKGCNVGFSLQVNKATPKQGIRLASNYLQTEFLNL